MQFERAKRLSVEERDKSQKFAFGGELSSSGDGYFIAPIIVSFQPNDSKIVQKPILRNALAQEIE